MIKVAGEVFRVICGRRALSRNMNANKNSREIFCRALSEFPTNFYKKRLWAEFPFFLVISTLIFCSLCLMFSMLCVLFFFWELPHKKGVCTRSLLLRAGSTRQSSCGRETFSGLLLWPNSLIKVVPWEETSSMTNFLQIFAKSVKNPASNVTFWRPKDNVQSSVQSLVLGHLRNSQTQCISGPKRRQKPSL